MAEINTRDFTRTNHGGQIHTVHCLNLKELMTQWFVPVLSQEHNNAFALGQEI